MRIGIVHNGIVPPTLYGGTERVVASLVKGLEELGNEVILISKKNKDSQFKNQIFIEDGVDFKSLNNKVDVLHLHSGVDGLEDFKRPIITTIHGNIGFGFKLHKNTVFVSKNHASRYGSDSFVYNGLDWREYAEPNLNSERKYFHFLGKAAWRVKNVQGAIDIINEIPKERLVVMGGVRFNVNMGLRFTFSPKISFKGMVTDSEKSKIMQESKGLIFPVRWNEPFGLAIVESLYFGCPVFGTPYGSLPELVNEEVGFLSNLKEELKEKIKDLNRYNKMICHEYAKQNFNHIQMAKAYLECYQKVLDGEMLNVNEPTLIQKEEKFLDWK